MTPARTVQATTDGDRDHAKGAAARAFDRAIRACDLSNEDVGGMLGIGATRVRRMRSDDANDLDVVPNGADLILADHALGERFLLELKVERVLRHGVGPRASLEVKAMAVVAASAKAQAVIATAAGDGRITRCELPAIEGALRDAEAAQSEFSRAAREASK